MTDKTNPKTAKQLQDAQAVADAIAAMPAADRAIGERLHEIITTNAPQLSPRTWYGMPAYSNGNKIVCFFRSRQKFGERFMTLGFNDTATLDEGNMWPIYYAIAELDDNEAARVAELIRRAVS